MAGGRPLEFNDEILEKAKEYADNYEVVGVGEVVPTIEGLALYLGKNKTTRS